MPPNNHIITTPQQATSTWLTAVLTECGTLLSGQVTHVSAQTGGGHWSQNARLTLTYSNNAQGDCPTKLFLKLCNTDVGDGESFLPSEVTYYTRDYIDVPDAPLVRCYDAAYDPTLNWYYLLLDDVSETHKPAYNLKPTLAHGQALAEALAILHAHWWGETRLKYIKASFHSSTHIRRFIHMADPGIPHAKKIFGDRLKAHWQTVIYIIFEELPIKLVARAEDTTHFTPIHGDPNPGNILIPRVGDRPLYLIDQQPFNWSLRTWLSAYDLAYIMALYWPTKLRRALEVPVLRHYHNTLVERGIKDYSWEQLYDDYRLNVLLTVPIAVEYMRDGGDPDWNNFRYGLLSRSLTACDDLDCVQLLR